MGVLAMNKIMLTLALATPWLVGLACVMYAISLPVLATSQMFLIIGTVWFGFGFTGLVLTLAIAQFGKVQRGE